MRLLVSNDSLSKVLYSIVVGVLFFQYLLAPLSLLSNLSLLILSLLNYRQLSNAGKRIWIYVVLFVGLLVGYSLIEGNKITLIARFAIMVFLILTSYLCKSQLQFFFRLVVWVGLAGALIMIAQEIYLLSLSASEANAVRIWVSSFNVGSITPYGFYYKVQLKGYALMPFMFMLCSVYPAFANKRYNRCCKLLFLLATFVAGNFSFFLSVLTFMSIQFVRNIKTYKQFYRKAFLAFLLLCLCTIPLLSFITKTLEEKAEYSNAIRVEQSIALLDDWSSSPVSILLGKGIGHTMQKAASFRDYTDNIYFEVQSLYFFNQLGIVFFLLVILIQLYFVSEYIPSRSLQIVYGCYVIYAVTNPYIFDTNQIVVIFALLSVQTLINQTKRGVLISK